MRLELGEGGRLGHAVPYRSVISLKHKGKPWERSKQKKKHASNFFYILFIHDRQRERERERGRDTSHPGTPTYHGFSLG